MDESTKTTRIPSCTCWLGTHGVYVNSVIMDVRGSSENGIPIRLRADSFQLDYITLIWGVFDAIVLVNESMNTCIWVIL